MSKFEEYLNEKTLTTFQQKHKYASKVEHKCDGNLDSEGTCKKCGRILTKKGTHSPDRTGSLGYTYKFADGSTYTSSNEKEKYMSKFEQYLDEMALPRDEDLSKVYYHGTNTKSAIEGIMKNGITAPDLTDRKGFLKPREGKVYMTPDLHYAAMYCMGYNGAGHEFYDKEFKRNEQFGYMCVIDGKQLADIEPDEDSIGEFIAYKKVQWLTDMAHRLLSRGALDKIYDGKVAYQARAGKTLVKKMTDKQKLELISLGAHIAHHGTIIPSQIWKFDKLNSVHLKSDSSNFFDLAEKIKG